MKEMVSAINKIVEAGKAVIEFSPYAIEAIAIVAILWILIEVIDLAIKIVKFMAFMKKPFRWFQKTDKREREKAEERQPQVVVVVAGERSSNREKEVSPYDIFFPPMGKIPSLPPPVHVENRPSWQEILRPLPSADLRRTRSMKQAIEEAIRECPDPEVRDRLSSLLSLKRGREIAEKITHLIE
jgi:hypothetical protein